MAALVEEVLPPSLDATAEQPPLFDGSTRLYTAYICPYAQRVWIIRNYKGLQDKIKLVPLNLYNRPDWYKEKVYPINKVFGKDEDIEQSSVPPTMMAPNVYREIEEEVRLGSQDFNIPNNGESETSFTQDATDEEPSELSTSRASVSTKRYRGSKRKRPSFYTEMIDVMRMVIDMHSSHMSRLVLWQKEKFELEFGRRKEAVNAIYSIDGLTEDYQLNLIDLIVTDIQKTDCFLAIPEQVRKRYCLRLLSRTAQTQPPKITITGM